MDSGWDISDAYVERSLREELRSVHEHRQELAQRIADLERELAEGAKDAERWRYFKHCFDHPMERRELARRLGCSDKEFDPDLDAAIDSAMAKEGK